LNECSCRATGELDLVRDAISKRIRISNSLKRGLTLVVRHADQEHRLYRCEVCGSLWQAAYASNWGAKEYFFQVLHIESVDWEKERYVDPDELLLFVAVITSFLGQQGLELAASACRVEDCGEKAIRLSAFCVRHHVENLQRVGQLPPHPEGRFFGTYSSLDRDRLGTYLKSIQARLPRG
jgi:hypothetical protein